MNLTILPLNATHITRNTETWIDHIIVLNPGKALSHGQFSVPGISKHDLIYLSYNLKCPRYVPKIIKYRDFKNLNANSFISEGISAPWDLVYNATTLNSKVDVFTQILGRLINKHVPQKTSRVTRPAAPWITSDIRKIMKERDSAYKVFRKTRIISDHVTYKKLRNRVTQMLRNTKIKYYHSLFQNNRDSKLVWKNLRSIGIGNIRNQTEINVSLDSLNHAFVNLAQQIDPTLKSRTLHTLQSMESDFKDSFYFASATPVDVMKIILSLKSNASGSDGISAKLLKLAAEVALPTIVYIINFSLMSGEFPSAWKTALVHPLPKGTNPKTPLDYRPISILPTISKVLEKIARKQIEQHLQNFNILNNNQSGFRPGKSTGTALLSVIEEARLAMDHGEVTIIVLLDFSKAFDSVDHDILLAKLKILGFGATTLQWFSSYLSERQQKVVFGDRVSRVLPLARGVAQGSVLGPLAFLIYVNDVGESIKNCSHHMYADDLQLYISGRPSRASELIQKINEDLLSLSSWSKSMGLVLNPQKSQCLLIGSKNSLKKLSNSVLPDVSVNGSSLPWCNEVRNLGVHMDNTLNWNVHTGKICQKVFASLHVLKRMRTLLPTKTRQTLVQSLLMPHFDYCDFLLTNINSKHQRKIQVAQNACIRFIYDLEKYDHISNFYAQSKILTINKRRALHCLLLLYKILNSNYHTALLKRFQIMKLHRARTSRLICIPQHNTTIVS